MPTRIDQAIMDQCVEDFRELLESNWDQIASMKDENEGLIKVTAACLISFKGNEQAVKTTITFGRMVKESRESIVNPDQAVMAFANGDTEPPAPAEAMQEDKVPPGKRRRHAPTD